jgi:hypothetical protein
VVRLHCGAGKYEEDSISRWNVSVAYEAEPLFDRSMVLDCSVNTFGIVQTE